MKRSLGAAGLLVAAGCLNTADTSNALTLDFDFNTVGENYVSGLADVPASQVADVAFTGELRTLPAPLDANRKALYLAGTNVSGDMFLFSQKYITGLFPNVTYRANLQVDFASNYPQGCTTGIGPGTFIKAGVSELQLIPAADDQDVLRMNINVGNHTSGGDYTRLGDIRNGLPGCSLPGVFAVAGTGSQRQAVSFTTDAAGGFFLWVGIDSSVPGRAEIYFTALRLVLF
jgi:hypothetical protein